MKVEHPTAISLDDSEMVCDLPKNPHSASTRTEEAIKDAFTGMIEELGDCNRIRGRYRMAD